MGGHECTIGNEFLQMVKRDALHAKGLSYGTKVNVPQIESVLTLEGVPWDGTLVLQHQKNPVKVKCLHLKWEKVGYFKNERCGICGLICIEGGGTLTLKVDDDTLMKQVAGCCLCDMLIKQVA